MDQYTNPLVEYYGGYLNALREVEAAKREYSPISLSALLADLTKKAVHELIEAVESEVKVPNAET